ncbi:MAG: chemotaxis protein CheX [Treponema sp.]|jgi:chemotaxis protein CheX|nr:chemotaxis protein CheX [Treponema sp.]
MAQQYIQSLIRPFAEVCIYVFKDLVGTNIAVNRPYFSDKEMLHNWDISALISFSGQVQGVVLISMNRSLAKELANRLTGTVHTAIDEDVTDALGEIVNIIAGRAKQSLQNTFKLIISLPTIILGSGYGIKWPIHRSRILCIPFTIFEQETFILTVALEPVEGGEHLSA